MTKIFVGMLLGAMVISQFSMQTEASVSHYNGEEYLVKTKLYNVSTKKKIENSSEIDLKDELAVDYYWDIPDNIEVKRNDTLLISLPISLRIKTKTQKVKSDKGQVVGMATIDDKNRTATIQFNDYFEKNNKDKNWFLDLRAELLPEAVSDNNQVDITLPLNKKISVKVTDLADINETIQRADEANVSLEKSGELTNDQIVWTIKGKITRGALKHTFLKDSLGDKQRFIEESMEAYIVEYLPDGNVKIIDKLDTNDVLNSENSSFELGLDGVSKGIFIQYKTAILDRTKMTSYDNLAQVFHHQDLLAEASAVVEHQVKKGQIQIYVHDAEDEKKGLANAEFELKNLDDGTKMTVVSDEQGQISINGVPTGHYQIKQLTTAPDYEIAGAPYDIELTEDELTYQLDVKNKRIQSTGLIHVIKFDRETGKRLPGAEYLIKDSEGKVVSEFVTDKNGEFWSDKLPYGKYNVIETKPPKGYKPISE